MLKLAHHQRVLVFRIKFGLEAMALNSNFVAVMKVCLTPRFSQRRPQLVMETQWKLQMLKNQNRMFFDQLVFQDIQLRRECWIRMYDINQELKNRIVQGITIFNQQFKLKDNILSRFHKAWKAIGMILITQMTVYGSSLLADDYHTMRADEGI
jgi:hypothetical protein